MIEPDAQGVLTKFRFDEVGEEESAEAAISLNEAIQGLGSLFAQPAVA